MKGICILYYVSINYQGQKTSFSPQSYFFFSVLLQTRISTDVCNEFVKCSTPLSIINHQQSLHFIFDAPGDPEDLRRNGHFATVILTFDNILYENKAIHLFCIICFSAAIIFVCIYSLYCVRIIIICRYNDTAATIMQRDLMAGGRRSLRINISFWVEQII